MICVCELLPAIVLNSWGRTRLKNILHIWKLIYINISIWKILYGICRFLERNFETFDSVSILYNITSCLTMR